MQFWLDIADFAVKALLIVIAIGAVAFVIARASRGEREPGPGLAVDLLNDRYRDDKATLDIALQKAPKNYRKLVRLGSYGSWINQYLCGMSVRVTDLQGRTAYFPWIMQHTGRCAEP